MVWRNIPWVHHKPEQLILIRIFSSAPCAFNSFKMCFVVDIACHKVNVHLWSETLPASFILLLVGADCFVTHPGFTLIRSRFIFIQHICSCPGPIVKQIETDKGAASCHNLNNFYLYMKVDSFIVNVLFQINFWGSSRVETQKLWRHIKLP